MADTTVAKDTQHQIGNIIAYPMLTNTSLVEGAAVMTNAAGYLVNAADTASCIFAGIVDKSISNNPGASGAKKARVRANGIHDFVTAGLTQADVGKKVYAVDNQTVALAATTTNDVLVGQIVEFISATKVRVRITPAA